MENQGFDPKKALLVTRIIFFAIVTGSLLFLAVVLLITKGKLAYAMNLSDPLVIVLTFLSISVIPAGYIISGRLFGKLQADESIEKKYTAYQTGIIIRLASCESVTLISVVCLLITNNSFFVFFFLFAFLIMLRNYPGPASIARELNLSLSETEKFY